MNKILTFDTYRDAYEQLIERQSEKNLESMLELDKRLEAKNLEKAQRQNIGQGLELTYILQLGFGLEFRQGRYYYEETHNNWIKVYCFSGAYETIPKLIEALKCREAECDLKGKYRGAKVNILFFTLGKEEIPIYTEEQKKHIDSRIESGLKDVPPEEKSIHRQTIHYLARRKDDTNRGLTEKEREEFERLYFTEGRK